MSKNQRDNLRKTTGRFVEEHFFGELVQRFEEKGFSGLKFELVDEVESDKDRKININYPNLIEPPGYLLPRVQIEISCRSLREPFTIQSIASLVDESYPEAEFAMPSIHIPTVNPERTFLEKVFLLHEEFHRPKHKMRVDRLSRHLYDIVKLARTEIADKALDDRVLYQTIVEHRQKFTRVGGIDYNLHQPQTIDPIPIPENIDAWRADYNTMIQQMIYETNPPSFDQMIAEITELRSRINALTWKLETEFPTLIIYELHIAIAKRGFPLPVEVSPETILTHLNLLNSLRVRNAAILLLGKQPQRLFSAASIRLNWIGDIVKGCCRSEHNLILF